MAGGATVIDTAACASETAGMVQRSAKSRTSRTFGNVRMYHFLRRKMQRSSAKYKKQFPACVIRRHFAAAEVYAERHVGGRESAVARRAFGAGDAIQQSKIRVFISRVSS
jgi:hypothetical protein